MIIVYAGMGLLFLAFPAFYPDFNGTVRVIFGVLLILYAAYRAFRVIKEIFLHQDV